MNLYPLLMSPYFRHGSMTPWGGSMLGDIFGKNIPDDTTGESLEVSALPGMESVVANGSHAGQTFARIASEWGSALTGTEDTVFPLLLKLLDANGTLSVQVHPDDTYALANEGKLGKSEAWVILNCEPGAKIAYGLEGDVSAVEEASKDGSIENLMHWVTVRPGEVYYIPAGTVHALGKGVQCYEIQQSSDVTYRLWDWGRVGKDGKPRELHTKKAMDVIKAGRILPRPEGTTVLCKGGSRTYYISEPHFELCRLNLAGNMPLESGRMLMLTPLAPVTVTWGEGSLEINPFDTVVIPAALENVTVSGNGMVMMSSLPNREALRAELGYRAENVAGLVD